jgi:hypothetical protein
LKNSKVLAKTSNSSSARVKSPGFLSFLMRIWPRLYLFQSIRILWRLMDRMVNSILMWMGRIFIFLLSIEVCLSCLRFWRVGKLVRMNSLDFVMLMEMELLWLLSFRISWNRCRLIFIRKIFRLFITSLILIRIILSLKMNFWIRFKELKD